MRSIWLAGVATAASSTAAAAEVMSSAPPVTAAAAAAATAAFLPRGLGGALSWARLAGSRISRSSLAAAATKTPGFVIQGSSIGTTSTWAAGGTRQHMSTVAMARRLRPASQSLFSRSWVATLGSNTGAGGVGVGGGGSSSSSSSSSSSRTSRLMFSAEADVGSATRPQQAVEGKHEEALPGGEAGEGERESREAGAGPEPLKVNLLEMSNKEVEDFLVGMGEPKFRAKQVLKWIFDGGAGSFDDMANIPKPLRARLAKVATVGVLEVAAKQVSKDGTKKLAYRLSDGQVIESVLMPYSDGRRTACISSQAGCAMGCVFCATGQMGFKRQLSAAEIFEQAYRFSQELQARGDRLSNVVFMGMGEPLANYKNVMEAVRRINTELGIGARHITISTVGLVPRILRLSQEDIQVKLAVSLHAANDRERSALLPVNRRFPLPELMEACREYVDASGRRMTFEWALIQGQNDSSEVASELGRLLRPLKGMCHVNIIPLNPTAGYKGGPSMADAVNQFVEVLARNGVPATPRIRRGIDIDAGCGQLTVKVAQDDVLGKGL